MLKARSAGSDVLLPMRKAAKFVSEATVTLTPAWRIVSAMRSSIESPGSVRSSALCKTKIPSTPMPEHEKPTSAAEGTTTALSHCRLASGGIERCACAQHCCSAPDAVRAMGAHRPG